MMQRFVEHDPEEHYFTLLERARRRVPPHGRVRHRDQQHRPQGRSLPPRRCRDGHIFGIDHGVSFHAQWKLRTVIWDFACEPIPPALVDDVCRVLAELDDGDVGRALSQLLSPAELAAIALRATDLLRDGVFPEPEPGYHSVPWPMV